MDNHEQLKDKVRLIFNSYKNDGPVMDIYQIKGEWIMGPSDEIGYKIMENDPKGMIKNALTNNEWFGKLMEAIAYADLNGFDVPKEAREIGRRMESFFDAADDNGDHRLDIDEITAELKAAATQEVNVEAD